jgi:hypothetical protein
MQLGLKGVDEIKSSVVACLQDAGGACHWNRKSTRGFSAISQCCGRPPALKPEHIAILLDIVTERAQASLQEIANELHRRSGVRVCDATIRRTLRAQASSGSN